MCSQPNWKPSSIGFGTPNVRDPAQGLVLKNCSLISGIASMAWKNMIGVQSFPFRFTFYDVNSLTGILINSDNYLPYNNGNLMHAISDDPSKIWPVLYEKAYYQFLDNLPSLTGRPNYCNYTGWQSPVTVLTQLLGKRPVQKNCLNANSDTVFSDIDNWCQNWDRNVTNRTIRTPAVAWTNSSGGQYSDTTIAVQHTYSLLGVTGTKSGANWTSKYMVLRNPYGKRKGDPATGTGTLFTGAWCGFNLSENDGLFALKASEFVKYFSGYAWTL
ncbi:MAG: C2 family cysteine protease [Methanoregula sp.]